MIRPLTLILVAAAALSLAGCARKASPTAPPGAFYPRTYPEIVVPTGTPDHSGTGPVDDTNPTGTNPTGPTAQQPESRSIFDGLKHPDAGGAK